MFEIGLSHSLIPPRFDDFFSIPLSSQLIGVEDGFLSLLSEEGETKDDLRIPEGEIGDEIKGRFERYSSSPFKICILYFFI